MAINPNTQYPGKIATPDVNYPYGGAQNITVPGDGTGTPWEKALVNDVFGLQQALLKSAAIVPSGAADKVGASQYLQSIVELASGRASIYTDSGAANAYVLTPLTDQEGPQSYYDGMEVWFIPTASNTGASTINVNGLGVKNIKWGQTNAALITSDIRVAHLIKLKYRSSSGTFRVYRERYQVSNATVASVAAGGATGVLAFANNLGTDDIDVSASMLGSVNNLISGEVMLPNGTFYVFGNAALSVPSIVAIPAAGTFNYKLYNHHAAIQDVTLNITARARTSVNTEY